MIIFGTRAARLNNVPAKGTACKSCDKTNTLSFTAFRKHFHVFWIPFFPVGKRGVSYCSHCKNTLYHKEFTDEMKQEYRTIKDELKGPMWQYSGVFILLTLFLLVWVASFI